MRDLLELAAKARVYDLAQPYFVGMPHHPVHPPFLYSLSKKHGDYVLANGASSAAEAIALGGHVGTHIDALCHFSCGGKLFAGVETAGIQSYERGLAAHSVDTIAPILRRGVLLDFAAAGPLAADRTITPEEMEDACERQGVGVQAGDVVLLRTGWARFWDDPARYIAQVRGPGPEEAGGRWLSERQVFAAGSDTIAFERVPSHTMPVHVHLLVENGIHILEALNLEELARDQVWEFLFLAAPLKIRGGTGSPIRPLAVVG